MQNQQRHNNETHVAEVILELGFVFESDLVGALGFIVTLSGASCSQSTTTLGCEVQ